MATIETIDLRPSALRVLQARYLRNDADGNPVETPDEMFRRVAAAVAAAEAGYGATPDEQRRWEEAFHGSMCSLEFLPNSPTLMNAGTELPQLSACFVLPVEDSMEGIFDAVKHTAIIHKSGGGTGFSFSRVRPKNDRVKSTHGVSSGPVSFMAVFDAATETVRQGGKRRGANMAMLRVDHPDILEFIDAKSSSRRLNNFNLSVALTDSFMDAVANDTSFDLVNPRNGQATGALRAGDVFQLIVDRAWRSGEPGVVFIDCMNRDNPTPVMGKIESTNPCGEQPLFPAFEQSVYAARKLPPRRNATVTTVAPTGSISIIAGTSSGVEPLFALAYQRRVLDGDTLTEVHPRFEEVARREGFYSDALIERIARLGRIGDDAEVPKRWRAVFQTAHEVSPEGHVRIQAAFQRHTENAVSKTVNLAHDATPDDVERVFRLAFELGCKGVTVYRDGSREAQVLSTGPATEETRELRVPIARPETLAGRTVRMTTGCGNLYVTTNEGERGPLELFAHIGKAGGCATSLTEAIGRLVSLALRSGVDPFAVARQLRGVRCPFPSWNRGHRVLSCADAIGQVLEDGLTASPVSSEATAPGGRAERLAGTCAECGSVLEFEGGCVMCRACGFTRC